MKCYRCEKELQKGNIYPVKYGIRKDIRRWFCDANCMLLCIGGLGYEVLKDEI